MLSFGSQSNTIFNIALHLFCYILILGWILLALFHIIGLVYGLVLAVIVLALVWTFHISGMSYGFYKFHRKTTSNTFKELPGISIIKPLTCKDANLYENLKTFFTMNYPRFEILFCVQDHNSELIDMIEELRSKYPHIDSQLFVGPRVVEQKQENEINEENINYALTTRRKPVSRWRRIFCCGSQKTAPSDELLKTKSNEIKNPKIFNMLNAYEKAQYPFILISDSGLMMHEETLYDMALSMTDDVGLVHQMPFTRDRTGFAGSVEKVYFGTQHARMYMTINLIGINCVTGMSCLIRKECLDRAGGLKAFGHYIAEDYYIAYEIAKQGWKMRVASKPAQQNSGDYSISTWTDRMIRWCKLRMRLSPLAYIEPLQECLSSAILAGIVTNYLFEWNALVIAACHILVWFICDYLMLRITQGGPLPFSKFEFAIAWLVRELSSFYIYFKAFTGSSIIKWRGRKYRLGSGTRAEEVITSNSSLSSATVPSIIVDSSSSSTSSSNSNVSVTNSHLFSPLISSK